MDKQQKALYDKEYRERNKAKIALYREENKDKYKLSYEKNKGKYKEKSRERSKKWRESGGSEWMKEYRKENADKISAKNIEHKNKNKERNKEMKRIWRINNASKEKERYYTDPDFKLKRVMGARLRIALRGERTNKNNQTMTYVGCTKEELRLHLEKQFIEGMTWENHGKWHIDHKIPFKFYVDNGGLTEEALYKVMHFTNLQPLWAEENLSKNGKY